MTHIFTGGGDIDFHQILIKLIKFPLVNIGDSRIRRYNNNNDRDNIDKSTSPRAKRVENSANEVNEIGMK